MEKNSHFPAMTYEALQSLLGRSPVVRLLRAQNAPLVLSFLQREFKAQNQLVRPQYELKSRLVEYLEYLDEAELYARELSPSESADLLLQTWSDEQHRYLRRYPDEQGEPMLELTPYTEQAFQWIESLQTEEFVGTESRFLQLSRQLQEIVNYASADPEWRIAELKKQRAALNEEIRRIQRSGRVETYTDTQIKERFFHLLRNARELTSDFKQVEQNFKEISRSIYQKQTQQSMGRGQIVGYTLDATDALKDSDQGRSFYAFWQFMIADHKQDELNQLIEQVYEVLAERGIEAKDPFLKRLKFYLHHAGQRVLDSNHLIAEKLSRILAEQDRAERRRTRELINAIKHAAVTRAGLFQGKKAFTWLEGEPEVDLSLDRPLGERGQASTFAQQPQAVGEAEREALDLSELVDQFSLDRQQLEAQLAALLETRPEVPLDEVVAVYPIQKGLAEVVTYLAIASAGQQHRIDRQRQLSLRWETEAGQQQVQVPEVVYRRTAPGQQANSPPR
jgi:hypothetical protein